MNKTATVFLSLFIGVVCFCGGLAVGNIRFFELENGKVDKTVISALQSIPDGGEITITEKEFQVLNHDTEYKGIKETKAFTRIWSWFGLGGPEAAAMDQGISANGDIGKSKGYGVLERLWSTIKSLFWVIILYFVIYLVFSAVGLYVPALGVVAKVMLGVVTGGLSAIQWIFDAISKKKTEAALAQTVQGIDNAKAAMPKMKAVLNNHLAIAQDSGTKDIIASLRK